MTHYKLRTLRRCNNNITFEELKGIIAADLPGRFPTTSGQGDASVLSIYAVKIKNGKTASLEQGLMKLYADLHKAGINPLLHQLDNETSKELRKEIEKNELAYQIASQGDHQLNRAERAIQTFKSHFIAKLYGTDSSFPAKQWD